MRMNKIPVFLGHALLATAGPLLLAALTGVAEEDYLHRTIIANAWLDPPFSPLLWGSALIAGLFVNRVARRRSAQWVWITGVSWFALAVILDVNPFNPGWCKGCSFFQYLWETYFNDRECNHECIGLMFVTTPMLTSIAYSFGAVLALKFTSPKPEPSDTSERF